MAGLHRAVAEEDDRDRVVAAQPRRERAPERDRDVPADDAGRAHEAVLDVDEVHRAAEPAAEPVVAPHQLREHAVERRALRDRMPVRPVPRVDGVVVAQLRAHRRRDALLAHAQVDEAVHLVGALELADPLLEQPDPPHRREQVRVPARRRAAALPLRAATGAAPTTCCTAATILSSSGRTHASSGSL